MNRVAFQSWQNSDLIVRGCPAPLMGIVVCEALGAGSVQPVQLPVDVQPGLIKVHNSCSDQFLSDLLHYPLNPSCAALIYPGQHPDAQRDAEQISERLGWSIVGEKPAVL